MRIINLFGGDTNPSTFSMKRNTKAFCVFSIFLLNENSIPARRTMG
jgi:hypothetical protein